MKTFHIITLFPESIKNYIDYSILKRAIEDKKISVKFYDPKDFEKDKKKRVDDKPYSGSPGMVIRALPVIKAIEKAMGRSKGKTSASRQKVKIIFLTPQGKQFDNTYAKKVAKNYTDIIIIAGRYEGIDARVKKVFKTDEISIGPFVLAGGELPGMIITEIIARQVKGVLGNYNSLEESRNAPNDTYTRPEVFEYKKKKYKVPEVLLSGDHKKIEEWRQENAKKKKM